jgi:polysaccharide biosynthesis protein PslH
MKILFLTSKPPYPLSDGGCIATFNLIEAFADAGHEIHVLSIATPKHPAPDNMPQSVSGKAHFHFVDIDTSVALLDMIANLAFSRLPYNAARFISADYKAKLEHLLQAHTFDIVQLEGLYVCPYIDTVRAGTGAFLAFRSHNLEHEIWKRAAASEKRSAKKGYIKHLARRLERFERSFINKYDAIIPITERDSKAFAKLGNARPCHISPAGYNMGKWKEQGTGKHQTDIFFLGALDWKPNRDGITWFLDNVWGNLSNKFPKLKFYLAGRNAPASFAAKVEHIAGLVYLGEVPDASLFMRQHGIMVVPLFSGSGMRVKIIEGMAMGKPIISTPVGAEGIECTSGENIIVAGCQQAFFSEICRLVETPAIAAQIGANAREFVEENYDSNAIAYSLLSFYDRNINK